MNPLRRQAIAVIDFSPSRALALGFYHRLQRRAQRVALN